jgi:hypothetical protein
VFVKTLLRLLAVVAGLVLTMALAAPSAFAAPVRPPGCELPKPVDGVGELIDAVKKCAPPVVTTTVTPTTEPTKHKDPCKAEHKPKWCDDKDKDKHHDRDKDKDKDKDKDHKKDHDKDKDKDTVTHDDDNGEYTQVKDVPVGAVETGDGSSL